MSKEEIIQQITEQYAPLSQACQKDLANSSRVVYLPKDHDFVRAGMYAHESFFVAKGCVRAYYLKDGRDVTDWFAFEGEFINAMNSFFEEVPSPYFIATVENCALLEISREAIYKLSEKHKEFDRLGTTLLVRTMLRLQKRVVSLQFETAQQKYESLLNQRPDIVQRVPLTHIASFLGITLETLSRIRSKRI